MFDFHDLIFGISCLIFHQGHELDKPENIYNLLGSHINGHEQNVKLPDEGNSMSIKYLAKEGEILRKYFNANYFWWMSKKLKYILRKYVASTRNDFSTFCFLYNIEYSEIAYLLVIILQMVEVYLYMFCHSMLFHLSYISVGLTVIFVLLFPLWLLQLIHVMVKYMFLPKIASYSLPPSYLFPLINISV